MHHIRIIIMVLTFFTSLSPTAVKKIPAPSSSASTLIIGRVKVDWNNYKGLKRLEMGNIKITIEHKDFNEKKQSTLSAITDLEGFFVVPNGPYRGKFRIMKMETPQGAAISTPLDYHVIAPTTGIVNLGFLSYQIDSQGKIYSRLQKFPLDIHKAQEGHISARYSAQPGPLHLDIASRYDLSTWQDHLNQDRVRCHEYARIIHQDLEKCGGEIEYRNVLTVVDGREKLEEGRLMIGGGVSVHFHGYKGIRRTFKEDLVARVQHTIELDDVTFKNQIKLPLDKDGYFLTANVLPIGKYMLLNVRIPGIKATVTMPWNSSRDAEDNLPRRILDIGTWELNVSESGALTGRCISERTGTKGPAGGDIEIIFDPEDKFPTYNYFIDKLSPSPLAQVVEEEKKRQYFEYKGIELNPNLNAAIKSLQIQVKKNPSDADSHYQLAVYYIHEDWKDEAIYHLKKCLSIKPTHLMAHIELAVLNNEKGQFDESIQLFREAISLEPNNTILYVALAMLYEQKESFNPALSMLDKAYNILKNRSGSGGVHPQAQPENKVIWSREKRLNFVLERAKLIPDGFHQNTLITLLLRKALLFNILKKHHQAANLLISVLKIQPLNSFARKELEETYILAGRLEERDNLLEESIHIYKNGLPGLSRKDELTRRAELADLYAQKRSYHQAVKQSWKALVLEDDAQKGFERLLRWLTETGQYDSAINLIDEAIRFEIGDPFLWLVKQGSLYEMKGNFEKAAQAYTRAKKLPVPELTYRLGRGGVSRNFNRIPGPGRRNQDIFLDSASDNIYIKHAWALVRASQVKDGINILQTLSQNDEMTGSSFLELGRVFLFLGNPRGARKYFIKSRDAFQEMVRSTNVNEPWLYYQLGMVQRQLMEIDSALNSFSLGIEKYYDFGFSLGGIPVSEFQKVILHRELGETYESIREYQKALEHYNIARELLAKMYLYAGNLTVIKNGFERSTSRESLPNLLLRIGEIHLKQQQYTKAMEAYTITEKYSKHAFFPHGEARALQGKGITFFRMGKVKQALDEFQAALRLVKSKRLTHLEGFIQKDLGALYLKTRQYAKAEKTFNQAETLINSIGLPESLWELHYYKGRLYETLNRDLDAYKSYHHAIKQIETVRSKIESNESRTGFFENKLEVYQRLIWLLLHQDKTAEAFMVFEQMKARSFLDMLGQQHTIYENWDDIDVKYFKVTKNYQPIIQELRTTLFKELSRPEYLQNKENIEDLKLRLENLEEEIEKFKPNFSKVNSQFESLISSKPISAAELSTLLDDSVTIVEYMVGEENIAIWVVDRNGISPAVVKVSRKTLIDLVDKFRRSLILVPGVQLNNLAAANQAELRQPGRSIPLSEVRPQNYKKLSQQLYSLLIKPIKHRIKTSKIVIVPHSVLHYLPFNALYDGKEYLIQKFIISFSPSSSILKFLFRQRNPDKGELLVLANPRTLHPNLPQAEREAKRIAALFDSKIVLSGEKATKDAFARLIKGKDYVHFATHGFFYPNQPLNSCLALTGEDSDDFLKVRDLFSLDLREANLVTLSACETGLNKVSLGDEIVGLAQGFFYAGTPFLVSTLWSVDDESTCIIMERFYKNMLVNRMGPIEALREAQISFAFARQNSGKTRGVILVNGSDSGFSKADMNQGHPYFWAPFVVSGSWK